MLVSNDCSRLSIVSVSWVSGVTTKALPAKTINAVSPSGRCASMSATLNRARVKRVGLISSASMERDRSRAITRAEVFLKTGVGRRSQLGPASAVMHSTAANSSDQRNDCWVLRCNTKGCSSGLTTDCHAPALR